MKKMILMAIVVLMAAFSMNAKAQYVVGNFYDQNGVSGIICYVDQTGQHGYVMSLDAATTGKKRNKPIPWAKDKKFAVANSPQCYDEDDGMNNMKKVEDYITSNNLTWDCFPLFEWARSLGEGWYIPAKNEMETIIKAMNGGSLEGFNSENWEIYNSNAKLKKGVSFFYLDGHLASFLTSTEAQGDNTNSVYQMFMVQKFGNAILQNHVGGYQKGNFKMITSSKTFLSGTFSRAIHKF